MTATVADACAHWKPTFDRSGIDHPGIWLCGLRDILLAMHDLRSDELRLPKSTDLMWPTLVAIRAIGGSATVQEIAKKVAENALFSESQWNALHGDGPQTEIEYRLAWARTYTVVDHNPVHVAALVWAYTTNFLGL